MAVSSYRVIDTCELWTIYYEEYTILCICLAENKKEVGGSWAKIWYIQVDFPIAGPYVDSKGIRLQSM